MVFFDWEPFEELDRLQKEMGRLIRGSFGEVPLLPGKIGRELAPWHGFRVPTTDVYETDKSVVAKFELPGADKKDIELNVTENGIEVKVEKKAETEEKRKNFYRYESRSSQFYRRVPLPEGVDASKADASYKDGILKVEIPKTAKAEHRKRIEVK